MKDEAKQMKDEVKKMKDEENEMKDEEKRMKDDLQRKSDQKEKDEQKVKDEIQSLRTRIQLESSDLTRQQDTIKQNQKNKKIEENMKHLIHKTEDLENRSRRDILGIISLPEDHDKRKSPDIILQKIIKENCPDILEQEGKVEIERIHRSPPVLNPQLTTPRNVIAKFKNYQTKEKILQAAKKKPLRYHRITVRTMQDLAASTLKDRKAWNMIFWKARELGLQPRIKYPAKLTIFLQDKVWSFNKIEEFQEFAKKRPDLNRKFDVQAQNSRESSKGN
uniref:L1 transposable element RRM domain-containing protein n=1 Tax=Monodelphis domestica TaxID=13616 RepID=A0A5F8G8P8_MONDO